MSHCNACDSFLQLLCVNAYQQNQRGLRFLAALSQHTALMPGLLSHLWFLHSSPGVLSLTATKKFQFPGSSFPFHSFLTSVWVYQSICYCKIMILSRRLFFGYLYSTCTLLSLGSQSYLVLNHLDAP